MVKPFSIQAPEEVAKVYGGDKQKIAQAAQMGIVDPTAAVLAGMFIDKMRSAQMQENANPPTIAQQVMGGAPAAQGAPPASSSPAGGLGATPQAAPPMAPQGMPPQMDQGMAPQGMAAGGSVPPYASGGGLSDVPIPDTMFDEPSNGGFGDGYAGGGIVAFAHGGPLTDDEAWARIKRLEGGLGPHGEMLVSSAGAVGPAQLLPSTAPEAAKLAGLPWDEKRFRTDREYNDALGRAYYLSRVAARGGDYAKGALDYHTGMGNVDRGKIGPQGREYLRKFGSTDLPERDTSTTQGEVESTADRFRYLRNEFGPSEEERAANEAITTRAKEMMSEEGYEKRRKADMWQTLAEIGFGMASSSSPHFLQAVGEAAAAALPGARADKKERQAIKDRGLELLSEITGKSRKENMELYKLAVDTTKDHIAQQQRERTIGIEEKNAATQAAQAANQAAYQQGVLGIQAKQLEMGKTPLQQLTIAKFNNYKRQNEQGKYIDQNGHRAPYKVADEALYDRAASEAAKELHAGQAGMGQDFLNPQNAQQGSQTGWGTASVVNQ